MVDKWREVKLGEIAEIYDGPHATPKKTESGPIFLGISNLSRGLLDLSNTEHISENDFHRWTRRVEPEEGDVVFSYETRLGEAARISHGLRCCLGRRMGLLRARVDLVDPRFLLYAYLGPDFQDTLYSLTVHGSTVDRIPLINMPHFPIVIPGNIQEQRRIAHILGTLDDKIENNRKTAKTLEAMAQAIFKSWFVDFDPVRAKMAGESRESICKRLKLTPEILDLFPDRLVDSELGEIPEGWEVGTIIDIATISSGKRPENRLERPSEDAHIPLWGGNGPIGFVTEPLIYESCILTGRVGTLGTFFRINTPCWPSDNTLIIRAIKNAYYEYVFFNISQIDMTLLNRGSTQPLLTQSDLSSQPIVIPSSDIIGSFHDVSYTLLQYANFFSLNYSYVVIARDTLLPKLISGEIRVPEAKYCVEAAMSGEV